MSAIGGLSRHFVLELGGLAGALFGHWRFCWGRFFQHVISRCGGARHRSVRLGRERIALSCDRPFTCDEAAFESASGLHYSTVGFSLDAVLMFCMDLHGRALTGVAVTRELQALVDAARNRPFSDAEREAQRRSFA